MFEDYDATETIDCPCCGEPVYEDAEQCPTCGTYLTDEDAEVSERKPAWLVWGSLVCLIIVVGWIFGTW